MSKWIYTKEHNNYDFELNHIYEGSEVFGEWLLIDGQLYRKNCFEFFRK